MHMPLSFSEMKKGNMGQHGGVGHAQERLNQCATRPITDDLR
jgi:hypothetical protein